MSNDIWINSETYLSDETIQEASACHLATWMGYMSLCGVHDLDDFIIDPRVMRDLEEVFIMPLQSSALWEVRGMVLHLYNPDIVRLTNPYDD